MNVQTEHLEGQTARFTVEIDQERLDQAKQKAARHIAKRVNIPGFRKGKVPYRILVQNGLEPQIEMDAIEELSQEIYRETLEQSDLEPYGPGAFEDYKAEPAPTFIYTVPLQPAVKLNDYLEVREEYTEPEVSDETVDDAMKRLQQQEALVEESQQPVAMGNQVTIDVHSEFADDAPETAEESDDDEETPAAPEKGTMFVHEHDAQVLLEEDEEVIIPGFKEQLIGANAGDELEFELTIPEDNDEYEDVKGRKIHFHVSVKKVENITLPTLNDDFAARVTEDEEEPLTLLQLRVRMRENIEADLKRRVHDAYASTVLGKMVEGADIAYPEAMVEDQIDSMINDLDNRLQQQGMNLETYMRVTGMTRDDLKEQYHENAEDSIKRSLVLREIIQVENLEASEERITERIDNMLVQFGDQAESLRAMFDTPQMRNAMVNDILQEMVIDRVVAIGKGELTPVDEPEEEQTVTDTEETE